ncbi:MAG: hypothetical protein ACFWT5_02430 [Pseudomonas helleri]|jgi:hypothetical protein
MSQPFKELHMTEASQHAAFSLDATPQRALSTLPEIAS